MFEPATMADLGRLVELEQTLFMTDHSSRKNFRYLIPRVNVVVARTGKLDEIAGYAVLLGRKNSRKMRIYSLGVAESKRNRGIGTKLVSVLETIANKANCTMLTLEVNDSNIAAIGFYNRCGFKQCGFRLSYYKDGGHALLMRKNLTVRFPE